MRPFRVEIKLLTPVALNAQFIHFDAIIAHLRAMRAKGREFYHLYTKRVMVVSDDEDVFMMSHGVFHASAGIFVNANNAWSGYYKRFDEFAYFSTTKGRQDKKIEIGRGYYKVFAMRTTYIAAEKVIFYGCGNIEKIRDLLSDLTHVGGDLRVGWGRVGEVLIEEESEDYSLLKDGKAMRSIPIAHVRKASNVAPLPFRPPYWAVENIDLCVVPFSECEL